MQHAGVAVAVVGAMMTVFGIMLAGAGLKRPHLFIMGCIMIPVGICAFILAPVDCVSGECAVVDTPSGGQGINSEEALKPTR